MKQVGNAQPGGFAFSDANLDQIWLDPDAQAQIAETGKLILVEGCFDVAKCVEAGVKNVVASFGTSVSQAQIDKLHMLKEVLGAKGTLVWFDRDKAGSEMQQALVDALNADQLPTRGFDWGQRFRSDVRGDVVIPEGIAQQCLERFSPQTLSWFASKPLPGNGRP